MSRKTPHTLDLSQKQMFFYKKGQKTPLIVK